jgi:ATP-dependent Clp protease ATP-binding subunit ClpX
LKFGLIPEFVGRLPVIVTLESLDKNALISILTKPKNALVKQYKKLFEMDNVELDFSEAALTAIANEAIERKTGARGLRSIVEDTMREIMYDIPSDETISKVIINEECVKDKKLPEIVKLAEGEARPQIRAAKKSKKRKDIETA